MQVTFRNIKTGELKRVKVGWSWTLFFFSGFFGLPLFLRKLNNIGCVFLALWAMHVIVPWIIPNEADAGIFAVSLSIVFIGLQVWVGLKGNEMTAKNYLEQGWEFSSPASDEASYARTKWGLAAPAPASA